MRRWMIERKAINSDRQILQVIEVYAPDESKEVVKAENRQWTHTRGLIRQ